MPMRSRAASIIEISVMSCPYNADVQAPYEVARIYETA
ncbi:hypothetical protein SZ54_3337 [Rhizobium sp. UR51a]|nr:hypothetical protein SZ54_3337 [Rhizobium sp. UR51a]